MAYHSPSRSLLLELFDRCLLFMSEGSSGPYAAAMGREEYEAMLLAKKAKQARRALRNLQKQQLIKLRQAGEKFIITLTKRGIIEALRASILHSKKRLPAGMLCIVSFDFPEDIRSARDLWRSFLRLAKFEQLHKSVWVSDRAVAGELAELIRALNAKRWVKVYQAQEKS